MLYDDKKADSTLSPGVDSSTNSTTAVVKQIYKARRFSDINIFGNWF